MYQHGEIHNGDYVSQVIPGLVKLQHLDVIVTRSGLALNVAIYRGDRFAGMADIVKEDYKADNLQATREALVKLAKEAMAMAEEHKSLGLTRAEMAFYHAIANPGNIQDFYTNDQLIELTKELTEAISAEMTVDWMMRESGRANVRRTIKRLLKRYKYPGNYNEAIQLVIKQAEHWDGLRTANN